MPVFTSLSDSIDVFLELYSVLSRNSDVLPQSFHDGSLTNALSKGHNVDEIFLDFSKAPHLVPHRRLIHKIREYCTPNELTVLLEDF